MSLKQRKYFLLHLPPLTSFPSYFPLTTLPYTASFSFLPIHTILNHLSQSISIFSASPPLLSYLIPFLPASSTSLLFHVTQNFSPYFLYLLIPLCIPPPLTTASFNRPSQLLFSIPFVSLFPLDSQPTLPLHSPFLP